MMKLLVTFQPVRVYESQGDRFITSSLALLAEGSLSIRLGNLKNG